MTCEYIDLCTTAVVDVQYEDLGLGYNVFLYYQRDDIASYTLDIQVTNSFEAEFESVRCNGYFFIEDFSVCQFDDGTSIDHLLTATPSIDS